MNRRSFLQRLTAGIAVGFLPFSKMLHAGEQVQVIRGPRSTLASYIQHIFAVRRSSLRIPYEERTLGVALLKPIEHRDGRIEYLNFYTREVSTPIVWSVSDEQKNQSDAQRIALATSLVENGIDCHNFQLAELATQGRLIVSKEYYCSPGDILHIPSAQGFCLKIYTAYCLVEN